MNARPLLLPLLLAVAACGDDEAAAPVPCETAAVEVLGTCTRDYASAVASCYAGQDGPCADDDAGTTAALDALDARLRESCVDGQLGSLSIDALVGRLRNACASEASSTAWRTYGGPQGAAWAAASEDDRTCLAAAHGAAADLVASELGLIQSCQAAGHCGGVAAERDARQGAALASIEAACADLAELVAVDPAVFVERAAGQVDCLAADAFVDDAALDLRCGPVHAQFDAPRGEWTVVEVDGGEWGTLCGDGSPYAFHVRLAPEGERVDRVVIGLQGGGVCLFEDDCTARLQSDPGLFTAMDDEVPLFGIMSDDPDESPFANWTRVYLPYCSQDVFAGGGVDEDLGGLTLPRHGSVNMRAAVQMVRDVIWKTMDAEGGSGFRPDEIVALFGGWSAGGYGTLYNYHWFLDDLQWPRTSAFPDAGLGFDNGSPLGVSGLGSVKIPAWGMRPNLPPYCFAGDCAVGEVIFNAISPRLKRVPEQQMLMLTNQYDTTQQNDAFFMDTPSFINELRRSYCATKDLPGIQFYYTSVSSEAVHVVSLRPEHWVGEVDGEVMRDWFLRAVTDADTIEDRVEEGDFATVLPGVEAFPCEVAP
jgi:pectinacetylesterase